MKPVFVVELTDPYGHEHYIATNVQDEEDLKRLKVSIRSWHPDVLPRTKSKYGRNYGIEYQAIFDSLKHETGHDFYKLKPDYNIHTTYLHS